jgi:WD40 repeat protein
VDRSPDGSLIATGDDFRRVKIFKYPCPKERSKFKEYKGHSEFVTNVKFSKDGSWLYTVGGLDKAVCQFEVKPGTERNDQFANLTSSTIPSTSHIVRSEVTGKSRTKKK